MVFLKISGGATLAFNGLISEAKFRDDPVLSSLLITILLQDDFTFQVRANEDGEESLLEPAVVLERPRQELMKYDVHPNALTQSGSYHFSCKSHLEIGDSGLYRGVRFWQSYSFLDRSLSTLYFSKSPPNAYMHKVKNRNTRKGC